MPVRAASADLNKSKQLCAGDSAHYSGDPCFGVRRQSEATMALCMPLAIDYSITPLFHFCYGSTVTVAFLVAMTSPALMRGIETPATFAGADSDS